MSDDSLTPVGIEDEFQDPFHAFRFGFSRIGGLSYVHIEELEGVVGEGDGDDVPIQQAVWGRAKGGGLNIRVVGECMQEVFQVHGPSVTSGPDTLWGTASVEK